MTRQPVSEIPQVVSILKTRKDGSISFSKGLCARLGVVRDEVHMALGHEVLLSGKPSGGSIPLTLARGRLRFPHKALAAMGLDSVGYVALIQRVEWAYRRDAAWAAKRVCVEERPGRRAAVADWETPYRLLRILYTGPPPEEVLAKLEELPPDPGMIDRALAFLSGRDGIEAWEARRLLGAPDPEDEALRRLFVAERLETQEGDGSWGGELPLTSRRLRELATLGLDREHEAVRRGAQWLLDRPGSTANPGMWFLTDELVAEQARILEDRRRRRGGRFRERKRSEMTLYSRGDGLVCEPCGPRIMWPNSLAMEALIALGYEEHPRVQSALDFLSQGHWCECGYQHGHGNGRRQSPTPAEFEARFLGDFRTGGVGGAERLLHSALMITMGPRLERLSERREGDADVYELSMPGHGQHCESLTVRGVAGTNHPKMRQVAAAYLWHFASLQNEPDGGMTGRESSRFFWSPEAAMLDLFARYDHPASRLAILRALAWMKRSQNDDGSWGQGKHKDAVTLGVTRALARVLPVPA